MAEMVASVVVGGVGTLPTRHRRCRRQRPRQQSRSECTAAKAGAAEVDAGVARAGGRRDMLSSAAAAAMAGAVLSTGAPCASAANVVQAPTDEAVRVQLEVRNFVSKEIAFAIPEGWEDDNKRIIAALAETDRVARDRYAQRLRDGPKLLSPDEMTGKKDVRDSDQARAYKEAGSADTAKARTASSPFAARFVAPNNSSGAAAVSVAVKAAQDMKLTLLTVKKMSDLGAVDDKDTVSLFVPPDARLVAPPSSDELSGREAYRYEFLARGRHVLLTAIARRGDVWVMAATADEQSWDEVRDALENTSYSFKVLRTKYG
uniref:PsbP C-terminal domain-containing protein n=1 Tax=Prasinoderma coloniale TaxID=156133 RepID=A0A7R9Y295_9VIRI